jgi:RecB family endonuclease NucS
MACAVWQVQQRTLSPDDRFVVIASDGLYDVLAVLPSPSKPIRYRTAPTTLCCARGHESASVCMAMRCSTVVRAQCQGTVEAAVDRTLPSNNVRHTD